MSMLAVLEQILTLLSADVVSSVGAVLSTGASAASFGVEATKCTPQSCPGSFYTAIATAWANIGYMTHSDVLHFLNTTNFGTWAIILYIGAAITGLLGVATNAPMKNYTWFFIGPALYSFLVGTTMEVQGVNWVVANKAQENMAEVWKNAETGLANTKLARDSTRGVTINGKDGPSGQYEVAMPMVFLDELFSATANILVEWTGIGTQVAGGKGTRTNLADNKAVRGEGPWWLLSTLKWGYIENITSATARNPDVRDALVTFLGSECGEKFKEGINSGAYIAATQARGATPITSVMVEEGKNNYELFLTDLNNIAIPAPRSLARLFKDRPGLTVQCNGAVCRRQPNQLAPVFLNFDLELSKGLDAGRGHGIVCSEYLWTLIQAFRYEAGQAYYQLTRSAPTGLDEEQFVNTLIYGWDVRKKPDGEIAKADEQQAFIKHLILAYIVRNELLFAPQITTVDQRFAPSEQAKSYSDAYVRSYGSKAKFIELYNAAIMMPYLQGILAYFLFVSYPIACMLVILPGHYKGFFTWVSFFAWIKIWDVGFAMVQVIERSVWAMVGNHGHMAATANVLIETAEKVGGIGVTNPVGMGMGTGGGVFNPANLAARGALPLVCSLPEKTMNADCSTGAAGAHQSLAKAVELFDKLLLTSANLDLDLSNGWYIYIMSALYLAVPAVTGQLVLGAKAGSAGMMKDAWSGVANDGSNAAKTGAQHKDVAALTANGTSLGQAAYAKAMSKGGAGSLAMQSFGAANKASDLGVDAANYGMIGQALNGAASAAGKSRESFNAAAAFGQTVVKGVGEYKTGMANKAADEAAAAPGGGAGGGKGRTPEELKKIAETTGIGANVLNNLASGGAQAGNMALARREHQRGIAALAAGQDLGWHKEANGLMAGGQQNYSRNLGSGAEFDAQMSAWEAKNDFAAHASATAGIAGMNAGSLASTPKPTDMTGMAMNGMLNSSSYDKATGSFINHDAQGAASYSGKGLQDKIAATRDDGLKNYGSAYVAQPWVETGRAFSVAEAGGYAARQSLYDPNTGQFTANENFINAEADKSYSNVSESNDIVKAARANAARVDEPPKAE